MTKPETTCIKPFPLGAHVENGAVRFSFVSKKSDCGILIYDRRTGKKLHKLPFEPKERIGNVYCKYLNGVDAEELSYQFYEGDELVPDRYARRFVNRVAFGRERKHQDWRAVIPRDEFDWEGDERPRIPFHECVCYCAHVRGFTKHPSSGVAHRGTFQGMVEKLDYLKETGITTVELQPVYEFAEIPTDEERKAVLGAQTAAYTPSAEDLDKLCPKKCNYWGYKQGFYYAPKAAYAAGDDPCTEFKEMVRAFHKKGIEIVMQIYFPKGIKLPKIAEILRFWVLEYHVDGFHLMGENLPVDLIATDDMFADTKLWYYYFDADKIYEAEEEPDYCNMAAYNDDYLYAMRKYLKGDENMLDTVLGQMRTIPKKLGRIHYMSNYYGFTLMDMVSYDRKHNEANGEDNRDGNDNNCSWNCGEEGPSRRKKIKQMRHKQIKNAMLLMLFTQSTPLIFMGDEFGNSQKGNNNPYCQDNATAWLDWKDLERNADIYAFWKEFVTLRREHPILHPEKELKIMDYISCGYPDLSYHGQSAWRPRMERYNRHIGIMYCGKYAKRDRNEEDLFFYLALNMYWETRELAMPKLPKGMRWQLLKCTDESVMTIEKENTPDIQAESVDSVIAVPGRSCSVYVSVPEAAGKKKGRRSKKQGAELYSDRSMF